MKAESALESPDPGTLLGGERRVLELIATGAPLETVLDALCRVIDEQSGLQSSIFLLRNVLQAGARGYILKSDADESLIAGIESLRQHTPFLTPKVTEFVLDDYLRRADEQGDEAPHTPLTAREREIIQLLAEGRSNKEAAAVLGISVKTIEAHRANLMRKLRLRSLSDLIRYAIRNKIVQV